MKKLLVLICLLVPVALAAQKQSSTITLPRDPFKVPGAKKVNWMKSAFEETINKEGYYSNWSDNIIYNAGYDLTDYEKLLSYIGRNQTLSKIAFEWLRPALRLKFKKMELMDRLELCTRFNHAIQYLTSFNYAKEQRYLAVNPERFFNESPDEFFDNEWKYIYPSELTTYDRWDESFLFRRIRSGVSKEMMIGFLKILKTDLNVNFKGPVIQKDENKLILAETYWNIDHFEGPYSTFQIDTIGGKRTSWLSETGQYQNGLKSGHWKSFELTNGERTLSSEITYEKGKPREFMGYYVEPIKLSNGETKNYDLVFNLNVAARVLDVKIYDKRSLYKSYSSIHDNIDFWDIYGTHRRLITYLAAPNYNIDDSLVNKTITEGDKPLVERNKKTNNYILYDALKRQGKDHALMIAIDSYENSYSFPTLKNPVKDVVEIGKDLKNIYGFDTTIVRNPSKTRLEAILEKYQKRVYQDDEQLFLFISGHGSYEPLLKEGFIVPNNGKSNVDDINHTSWLSYSELLSMVSGIKCNHIFLAIDACHSGAFQEIVYASKGDDDFRQKTSDPQRWFMNRIRFKTGLFVTSASKDRLSSDGIDHSPFASAFIQAFRSFGDVKSHILTDSDIYPYLDRNSPPPVKGHFRDNDPESLFFFVMK